MKVAILCGGWWNGAFGNVVASLSQALSKNGIHNIDIIYINKNQIIPKDKFPSNINFINLGCKRAITSPYFIKRYLKHQQPDFLISMPAYVNIMAIVSSLISNWQGKLVITEHAVMTQEQIEHKGELALGYMPFYARMLYRFSDAIVGVSSGVINDLNIKVGIDSPKMHVIPNAVDIDFVINSSKVISSPHKWLNCDTPCFIFVGRLVAQKNIPLLIESFAEVRNNIDAKLLIIGEGALKAELERKVRSLSLEKDVEFIDFTDNPYSYMKYADCFVLTSREEAFGLVLVESLSLNTPIVAIDSIGCGPREILDNGRYGALIPQGNKKSLVESMISTVTSKECNKNDLSFKRAENYKPINIGKEMA